MSKQVDIELINTKVRHREQLVHDGKFIEESEQEGRTSESIKKEAKDILGIAEEDMIVLEFADKLAAQNKMTKAFISLNNFISKAEETDVLTEEEFVNITNIEDRLSVKIAELYDIDIEDLFTKGDL